VSITKSTLFLKHFNRVQLVILLSTFDIQLIDFFLVEQNESFNSWTHSIRLSECHCWQC
jgi:hypothetical protein